MESSVESYNSNNMLEIASLNGWTPLHNASRWGSYATFLFLFDRYNEKSIMYNEPYSRSYNTKHNLLSLALRNKNSCITSYIIENINITFFMVLDEI